MDGYGRVVNMDYSHFNVDPRPDVLSLGKWRNHLGNLLVCGINLHYLSDDEILRVRKALPQILSDRNLRRRVRALRSALPDVFNKSYRTYRADRANIITKGTLKFYTSKQQERDAAKATKTPEKEPLVQMKKPTGKIAGLTDRIRGIWDKMTGKEVPKKPEEMGGEGVRPVSSIDKPELDQDEQAQLDKMDKLTDKSGVRPTDVEPVKKGGVHPSGKDPMDIEVEDEDTGDEGDEITDGGIK